MTARAIVLVGVMLAPAVAQAHPIARWHAPPPPPPPPVVVAEEPPPPPETPRPPRRQTLGYRFGMANMRLLGEERTRLTFGLQWGVAITGELRGYAEYEWLMLLGQAPPEDPDREVGGRGHAGRLGLRLPALQKTIGGNDTPLRLYVDLDAAAGAALLSDRALGTHVVPEVSAGARLGYEIFHADERGRPGFDAHISVRALTTAEHVGLAFGVGMEWVR